MSTRTNIIILAGDSRIYLYRHCDGYLAETGADLYEKARDAAGTPERHPSPTGAADKFLRALLAERYEQQSYEKEPRTVYELTSGLHGDIEHCYTIDFQARFNTGELSIRHATRPDDWHAIGAESVDWASAGRRYSLEEFAQAVNADRRACNKRLAELRASSKFYADSEDYPMIGDR